jgi:cold shock protein
MIEGIVKWFDDYKGFGFIRMENDETDIFVHHSSVITDGYQTLQKGQSVEFLLTTGDKGPVAQNVRVVIS